MLKSRIWRSVSNHQRVFLALILLLLMVGGIAFSIQLKSIIPAYSACTACLFVIYAHSGLRAYQDEVATMRRHVATLNQRVSTTMQSVDELRTPVSEMTNGLKKVEQSIADKTHPGIDNSEQAWQSTFEGLDKLTAGVGSINTKLSLIAPDATVGATSALTKLKKLRRDGPVLLIMKNCRAAALDAVAAGGLPDNSIVLDMNTEASMQNWPLPHSLGGILIALDDVPVHAEYFPARFWRWLRTDIPILSYADSPARLTKSAERFAAISKHELIATPLTSRTAAFARSFDVHN